MPPFQPLLLKNKELELTVFPEYGCCWSTLRIFLRGNWVDLLEPMFGDKPPFHYGSYVMAPWSNRLPQGVFEFNGRQYQLRKNFPDDTAIHGDVRTRPWNIELATREKVIASLDSRKFSDFNFPFKLKFTHTLELSENHVRMALVIENADSEDAPVGMGFHPFFKRRLTDRDQDIVVVLPAQKVYPDEQCIPTGPAMGVSGDTDLRRERPLGNPNLDHCFTDLTGKLIHLIYSGSNVEVHYEIESVFSHVVVYAPNDNSCQPEGFVAIEPVSHVNNGFNLHAKGWKNTGIKVLKPGETWGGTCELTIVTPHP